MSVDSPINASYSSGTVRQIVPHLVELVSVEMETSTTHPIPAQERIVAEDKVLPLPGQLKIILYSPKGIFWPKQLFPRLVRAVALSNILGYGDLTR